MKSVWFALLILHAVLNAISVWFALLILHAVLNAISVRGMPPYCQNCCGEHALCEDDLSMLVIDCESSLC